MTNEAETPVESIPSTDQAGEEAHQESNQPVQQPEAEAAKAAKDDDQQGKALAATQRRINRLTAEKYQERAQREHLERELQQFRQSGEQQPQHEPQQPYSREQVAREAAAIVEQQRFNDQCNRLATEGRKAAPDFDAQLATLASVTGPLFDDKGRPEPLLQALLATDAPHKVMLHLAAHPDVAADLIDLTPLQQARRLGRIESELSAPSKTSNAPRPIDPVKGSAASSGEPDPADTTRWIAWRNKQVSERRAR